MKLTLFTISNEQIKEQLSKLQNKVDSLETVKDVQDKIISAKDSQITFLQGEISSITTWVTWGAGAVITLASAAFIYIKFLEGKAKKKIEEAENTLQLAQEKLTKIETAKQQTETNLTESDEKIEQLNSLICASNNIATIAQEKINELETRQMELNEISASLVTNQKIDLMLKNINIQLGFIKKAIITFETIDRLSLKESREQQEKYIKFKDSYTRLENRYIKLSLIYNNKIIRGKDVNTNDINNLKYECTELRQEIHHALENYPNID
ncbi:ribonuclease H family protein [Bacillus toyonensis]|uniref:hypothetical protein n=1 Tax=Bacillus toyonensis TaxID=155322 RepID=UPI0036E3A0DB